MDQRIVRLSENRVFNEYLIDPPQLNSAAAVVEGFKFYGAARSV